MTADEPADESTLVCAFCAADYASDENYHEPFCSPECEEADAEMRAGEGIGDEQA